ncbi:MAG: prepilin-type N-terminal cleavage/methylation domain-containing protein [Holosporaceae bacterium]|nr:prepilin-type N-terminal cleavage/methylation domain-containing protein [Holosporaceae bacterium]
MIKFSRRDVGFSLIEVAIAVVVISIIVGFALKGGKLVNSVKLRSVLDQVESFRIAMQDFQMRYGAWPGDFHFAKEVINDSLENGSGNGSISSLDDSKRFWMHLIAAGLLNVELVNGLPQSKFGGYFSVSSSVDGHSGVWFILCGGTEDNKKFTGILSPKEAYFLDKGNDTGKPLIGDIRIIKSSTASGEVIENSNYNFKNENKDCVVLFKAL